MSSMFELFRKAKPFEPLYFACVERARAPWFYLHAGIPDEIAGRFELVALHVSIMIHELERRGFRDYGYGITEIMYKDFDRSLREYGVGDLSVGKKVRGMAEAFFGRAKAYGQAIEGQDDGNWCEALHRNLFRDDDQVKQEHLAIMAQYAVALLAALRSLDDGDFGKDFAMPLVAPFEDSSRS